MFDPSPGNWYVTGNGNVRDARRRHVATVTREGNDHHRSDAALIAAAPALYAAARHARNVIATQVVSHHQNDDWGKAYDLLDAVLGNIIANGQ